MSSKSPSIALLLLPLLLIIFTLSSEVESTGRKLRFYVPPARIMLTPRSNSCGTSPAGSVFSSKYWTSARPCRRARPPGTNIPVSDQSP